MFTKKQESELITAIKGRGEIPLKFAYLGEGAYNWDKIANSRSEKGGINKTESSLLKERIPSFLGAYSSTKKVNVVDIGCGNGISAYPVLEELKERKILFRYIPIDISETMLGLAVKNVKKEFGSIECKPIQLDFELGNFSDVLYELKGNGYINLMLFLGSTLGNHSDRHRVLTNFRDSMSVDDFLVIGVELTNIAKINKTLSHYEGELSENFLYFIPEKIGIDRKNTIFGVSWNESRRQIELRVVLKNDCEVEIGDEKFSLEKDEQLLVARSIKFTEWSITKLLSDIGFRTELLTTAPARDYILSMVQPTRYTI